MSRTKKQPVEAALAPVERSIKRSISMHDVTKKEFVMLDIPEEWRAYIGHPEENFRMLVYGESGGGKTTFVMRLCVMLAQLGKVYYNSAEEGEGSTIKAAALRVNVPTLCQPGSFMLGDRDTFEDMHHKLSMKRAARFCVIDSLQYMNLKEWQIKKLMADFPRKCFIVISWATSSGTMPKGTVAKNTEYMFDIKTMVNNGSAVSKSRYGATVPYEVYPPRPVPGKEAKKKGRPAKEKDNEPELFDSENDENEGD